MLVGGLLGLLADHKCRIYCGLVGGLIGLLAKYKRFIYGCVSSEGGLEGWMIFFW